MIMELTKAEMQVMQILWNIEKGFIKDILEFFPDPKPAYTTVATIFKILERKGFVGYKIYGNAYQYYPLVSKDEYAKTYVNPIFRRYFRGSICEVVTFFATNNKVKLKDMEEAIQALKELKKVKKQQHM
jgi:predicted transcriptional regulator